MHLSKKCGRKSSEISPEMTSKCPSRPMAAPRVWACAHVLRDLAGQEIPLSRDTAGARHSGISRGGALYCRAKLVCAARRKRANTPCAATRSPLALRPLSPKGWRYFRFKGFPHAASGLYPLLPAQPTRAGGRERGVNLGSKKKKVNSGRKNRFDTGQSKKSNRLTGQSKKIDSTHRPIKKIDGEVSGHPQVSSGHTRKCPARTPRKVFQ